MICTKNKLGFCSACKHGGQHFEEYEFSFATTNEKLDYLNSLVSKLFEISEEKREPS